MSCARGDMENRIKEQQLYLFADRISSAMIDRDASTGQRTLCECEFRFQLSLSRGILPDRFKPEEGVSTALLSFSTIKGSFDARIWVCSEHHKNTIFFVYWRVISPYPVCRGFFGYRKTSHCRRVNPEVRLRTESVLLFRRMRKEG